MLTGIARCVAFCLMSSEWFGRTEPSLATSSQGKQGLEGAQVLVRGFQANHMTSGRARCVEFCHSSAGFLHSFGLVHARRTSSNLLETHAYRESKVCRVLSQRSGWFDCTKPALSTALPGKPGL